MGLKHDVYFLLLDKKFAQIDGTCWRMVVLRNNPTWVLYALPMLCNINIYNRRQSVSCVTFGEKKVRLEER